MTKIAALRDMRLEKRLTQSEVAKALGVSQSYYSLIEQGEKPTEVELAMAQVNRMRSKKGNRTGGGGQKAGRQKRPVLD